MAFRTAIRGLAASAFLCLFVSGATAGQITGAEIDEAMAASPAAPIFAAVQKYFPEDAAFWRDELTKAAFRESGEIRFPRDVLALGAAIRKKHAGSLKFASGERLRDVASVQYKLHDAFRHDPDACARLILAGPKDMTNEELELMASISTDIGAQFAAMHEGTHDPIKHGTPTDAAWQGFYDSYRAQGNSDADYDLIIEPKYDPALCNAFLGFLAVLRDGEFEGADAIRALIVPALIGS